MFLLLVVAALPGAAQTVDYCAGGVAGAGSASTDLVVWKQTCTVDGSKPQYIYRNVHILEGGRLVFADKNIQFHARGILVENLGTITASVGFTTPQATLTIYLYGAPGDAPITCKDVTVVSNARTLKDDPTCDVPDKIWTSNVVNYMDASQKWPTSCKTVTEASGFTSLTPVRSTATTTMLASSAPTTTTSTVSTALPGDECFYQYMGMTGGMADYFGKKVLAVSYGGTLQLRGAKGVSTAADGDVSSSGTSWARLDKTVTGGETSLTLDRVVDWKPNDKIVVTATDYVPGHAEQLEIQSVATVNGVSVLTLKSGVAHPHNGQRYDYSQVPATIGPDHDPKLPPGKRYVETRAAVGLLTRSIRIVSEGAAPNEPFTEAPGNYYGGHTMFRQGFQSVQVQGVEFYQLGQGGAKGHYPVHFHLTRRVPSGTYVKDSSIWDSMTRWITLHGTQGVLLARNVGYKSIGHGFYLEDGTEAENVLVGNLGVFARAAVQNEQNPRQVPGILARPGDPGAEVVPFHSDYDHPTVFWIMNGWNDFQYNVAASTGACGVCYWLLPGGTSGPSQYQYWKGYAGQQNPTTGRAGISPLKSFVGNSCSTAMTSFLNISDTTSCLGVGNINDGQHLLPVANPLAPAFAPGDPNYDSYYPNITGLRRATLCPAGTDCTRNETNPPCAGTGPNQANCAATTLDRYTTSFNWPQKNFAAVWLRLWWFLVTDSAITDVQQGGLTFVSGGGYTHSDAAIGFWNIVRKTVFVGRTQPNVTGTQFPANPFAANSGPFNPQALKCDARRGDYCLSAKEGISIPFELFNVNQRFFNIYDGPAYQESNAYVNIPVTGIGRLSDCKPGGVNNPGACAGADWMQGTQIGVPKDMTVPGDPNPACILPNAAIAWKQPNGFYYPPAFHSRNLYFWNVAIRHFVIEPDFLPHQTTGRTYKTDQTRAQARYCTWAVDMFDNFTDVDRQTELNDDDGSLTGLLGKVGTANRETISVNLDEFFNAPKFTEECASDYHSGGVSATLPPATANTSPYEYVTTAMIAACGNGALSPQCGGQWGADCGGPQCFGVPMYRMFLTADEAAESPRPKPVIRMAGQGTGQRSTLSVNHGKYYIDTQVSLAAQQQALNAFPPIGVQPQYNVFQANQTYYVWLVYAKPSAQQTYQLYVGKDLNPATVAASVRPVRVNIDTSPYGFTAADSGDPAFLGTVTYDPGTGIVEIPISLAGYAGEFSADRSNFCKPSSYCQPSGSDCVCKPGTDCKDDNVCRWAIKEIDCPTKGCFGFGITLPGTFTATGVAAPEPGLFTDDPQYNTNWNIPWVRVPATVSGTQCFYNSDPD